MQEKSIFIVQSFKTGGFKPPYLDRSPERGVYEKRPIFAQKGYKYQRNRFFIV